MSSFRIAPAFGRRHVLSPELEQQLAERGRKLIRAIAMTLRGQHFDETQFEVLVGVALHDAASMTIGDMLAQMSPEATSTEDPKHEGEVTKPVRTPKPPRPSGR